MNKIIAFIICTLLMTTTGLSVTGLSENKKIFNNIEIKINSEVIDTDTKFDIDVSNRLKTHIFTSYFLKPKWTYDPLGNSTYGSIALEDIDDDGFLEILFSSGFDVFNQAPGWTYVLCYDGELYDGWPILTNSEPWHVPVAADIDPGFPGLEIITTSQIPGTFEEYTYAWHIDGTIVSGWPVMGGAASASASVGDVDGDGQLEVVHPSDNGYTADRGLHVRNGDGSEVNDWPVLDYDWRKFCTPAVADIDNNGNLEIIISFGSEIYVLNNDGSVMEGWPKNGSITGVGPVLADLDNDSDIEILISSNNNISAYHHTGEYVDGWPVSIEFPVYSSIVIGDVNNDFGLDVVVHSGNEIYVWNANGSLIHGWPIVVENVCCLLHPPILGDIDGDGTIEVILTNNDGLDAFHNNGERVGGFPMMFSKPDRVTMGSPALGDIDCDGKLELVAVIEGDVMVWDCESEIIEWPMFQFDAWNTGLYSLSPSKPSITGPAKGKAGDKYEYIFNAKDSDNDDLFYFINWGDNQVEEWIGPYTSGENVKINHTWSKKGTYIIKAKVKDEFGAESGWGVLEIKMPKNKHFIFNYPILCWLFECFPNMFPIMRFFTC